VDPVLNNHLGSVISTLSILALVILYLVRWFVELKGGGAARFAGLDKEVILSLTEALQELKTSREEQHNGSTSLLEAIRELRTAMNVQAEELRKFYQQLHDHEVREESILERSMGSQASLAVCMERMSRSLVTLEIMISKGKSVEG
jgi:hypothetical protein